MKNLQLSYRCENTTTYQVTPPPAVTSQEEEEEVKIHLPLSNEDLTVVCVANNLVGESRKEFLHRKC